MMKKTILFTTLFCLILASSFGDARCSSQITNDDIYNLARSLFPTLEDKTYIGPGIETQEEVKEKLLAIAQDSPEGRTRVVHALIRLLNDVVTLEEGSTAWYVGADILGELKATEAIDVLIAYIDYNDGTTGFSLAHIPSARALIQIGNPAVSKLSMALLYGQSLLNEDNFCVRENAARALGHIGGYQAKKSLKRALREETNKSVIFYIEQALKKIPERI